jgi:tyrosine-protein phosphatase SIW14
MSQDQTSDITSQPASDAPPSLNKPLRAGVGIIIAITFALFGWYAANHAGNWKDLFFPRRFRTIEPGKIYASGQINQRLIRKVLADNHIQYVISLVLEDPTDTDATAEQAAAKEMGIQWSRFPLAGDGTGDIHNYAGAVAAMADAVKKNEPVLVHCSSGAQRSNGATFYYRVLIEHWNADDAAAEMIRNGHDPKRNPVMIPYLNEHMAQIAQLLVQQGAIAKMPDPLPQIHLAP